MGSTHELLSHRQWEGIPLAELVKRQLAPYTTGSNIEIAGPEVMLSADAGQTMAMALHELATNAAKYGALSIETGRVAISWVANPAVNPTEVDLTWRESGGPAVKPPTRSGFGSMLLERVLAYEADGKVDLSFPKSGVEFNFKLTLSDKVRLS